MEEPLLKFTNETLAKLKNMKINLSDMSLDDLQDYLTGLRLFKP